uniref:ATP synthase F0 subunit 8 n=1 Tax=Cirroteuthis muelleri TaxID=202430 RepID=A0A9E9FUL4_9MOLL|nr:ATP synthase F0 subunit 8 [Cirroteuthis muelleri]WAP91414.1 ATP synthase F0 subunit 8 [Cirroteuthis muelleri]
MPQLSPLNWMFFFSFFWLIMISNSSIMWWNTKASYKINLAKKNSNISISYLW